MGVQSKEGTMTKRELSHLYGPHAARENSHHVVFAKHNGKVVSSNAK
jgi:hypothetical protein